jgi:hypothetical protein
MMRTLSHLSDTEQQVVQIAARMMNRLADMDTDGGS